MIDITSHAFQNISFTVHAGEIVGVAGIIGSGRTELAEAIFGLKTIKSGSILLEGNQLMRVLCIKARKGTGLCPRG